MTVFINNKEHNLTQSKNLFEVLTDVNLISQKGIAVAVNNTVISKSAWEKYQLNENDKITIITATQGG
ncbi:MAG: sulfur carrier protein ThiS [Bacteroidota bacterium]